MTRRIPTRRPRRRKDCVKGPRPCPWVRCRYHLHFELEGDLLEYRDMDSDVPHEPSCALDVANGGKHSSEEIAEIMQLPVAEVDEIAREALAKLRRKLDQ